MTNFMYFGFWFWFLGWDLHSLDLHNRGTMNGFKSFDTVEDWRNLFLSELCDGEPVKVDRH